MLSLITIFANPLCLPPPKAILCLCLLRWASQNTNFHAAAEVDVARVAAAKEEAVTKLLRDELANKKNSASIVSRHLQHTLGTAGIDKTKSVDLLSTTQEIIQRSSRDLEKLNITIYDATKTYQESLWMCRRELEARGISNDQVDSIDALGQESEK